MTLQSPFETDEGCDAVILAAGRSLRMGREKAALPWLQGKSLLLWMVESLIATGWRPLAVVGPTSFEAWTESLPSGCAVLNPHPERGKTTSLACGVARVRPASRWILVTAVDQPRRWEVYRQLREAAMTSDAKVIVPGRLGRRGHPVILSATFREQLLALDEENLGLRGLLDSLRSQTLFVPCEDATRWDFNTPEAYNEALAFFATASEEMFLRKEP